MNLNHCAAPCWWRPCLLPALCSDAVVRVLVPHLCAAHALFTCRSTSLLMLSFVELNIEEKKSFALLVHNIYISWRGLISGQPVQLCWFQVYLLCKQQPLQRFVSSAGEYWWALRVPAPLLGWMLNYEAVFCVCVCWLEKCFDLLFVCTSWLHRFIVQTHSNCVLFSESDPVLWWDFAALAAASLNSELTAPVERHT